MDNGTDFVLERSPRGTVIHAHNFLFEKKCQLKASNDHPLYLYVIDKMRFLNIVSKDKFLFETIKNFIEQFLDNDE
jgi:hypothetical protein